MYRKYNYFQKPSTVDKMNIEQLKKLQVYPFKKMRGL